MKFNKNTNLKAIFALNAGNFERENVNFAANLAMKFKSNFSDKFTAKWRKFKPKR